MYNYLPKETLKTIAENATISDLLDNDAIDMSDTSTVSDTPTVISKPSYDYTANIVPAVTSDQDNVAEAFESDLQSSSTLIQQLDAKRIAEIDSIYSDLPLSRLQRLVLCNWFNGKSVTEIAKNSHVTSHLINTWLRHSPTFIQATKLREEEMVISSRSILLSHLEKAAKTICLASDNGSLKAATLILELAGLTNEKKELVNKSNDAMQASIVNLTVNLSSHNDSLVESNDVIDSNIIDAEVITE